jgi:Protein of unknown function (DUF3619)
MNTFSKFDPHQHLDELQSRFALRVTAALSEQHDAMPRHDIDERLRFAREQALARAREVRRPAVAPAAVSVGGGAVALGGGNGSTPWWLRLSSLAPLALLVVGLLMIDRHYTHSQIEAAAEVDAALLVDDLPPEAYRDPGFVEFLKTSRP